MAGGGWSKAARSKGTLTERGIIGPPAQDPPAEDPPGRSPPQRPPRGGQGRPAGAVPRHCWVDDPPGFPGRWPGILVQWRRTAAGWEGRTVMVIVAREPMILDAWVDAGRLTPV